MMKFCLFLILMTFHFCLLGQSKTTVIIDNGLVPGKYIVTFKQDYLDSINSISNKSQKHAEVSNKINRIIKKHSISANSVGHVYANALAGFSISLNKGQFLALSKDPDIYSIDEDVEAQIIMADSTTSSQTIPWGIQHVGTGDGTGKRAWVVDTGIDFNHPDLNVDLSKVFDVFGGNGLDSNGHGTHVAGIIGAKNNGFGVVGVAANATLIPVKVMNQFGKGTLSNVLAGVNHISANGLPGDVANFSIIFTTTSTTLDNAVKNLGNKGIFVAMGAGNSSAHASGYSPARANGTNLYTVSAYTSDLSMWRNSNYGNPPVDYSAPGHQIPSTWLNNSYLNNTGTSMAAPHVAGILLVNNGVIYSDGFITGDKDNTPDAIAVLNDPTISPLPVEIVSFSAKSTEKGVLLNWTTASELNNDHFKIQRSSNGKSWEIAGIMPGKGTTSNIQHYSFLDVEPVMGFSFYRLQQFDFDGKSSYSKTIKVEFTKQLTITLSPVPVIDRLRISGLTGGSQIMIFQSSGKVVLNKIISDEQEIDLSSVSTGVYFVKVIENGEEKTFKIIKK
jgi:hypothetical protein